MKITSLFYNISILLLIFYMATASVLNTRYLPFAIGIIFLINHFLKNRGFNRKFLSLILLWLMINLLAMFVFVPFNFLRLIIITLNLLFLPYLMLKEMGIGFWDRFEKIIYTLTLISLPLFLLNNLFPAFFNSLWVIFNSITTPSLTRYGALNEYWTALIYRNAIEESGVRNILRNSGFMWEPGAFALMIVWGVIYNWLRKGMAINSRTIIYIIALLTTFSTAGYPALFILLLAYYSRKLTTINIIGIIILIFAFYYVFENSAFLSDELVAYTNTFELDPKGESGYLGRKVNRFQGGVASVLRTIDYPLGYGLISVFDRESHDFSYGVNGLTSLLEMWGIIGFAILMTYIYRSFILINQKLKSKRVVILLLIALMIMFFSNPIARFLLVYFLVLTPICFEKSIINSTNTFYKSM